MSAADTYARRFLGENVEVASSDGATNAMRAVRNGQFDATLQGSPGGPALRQDA